MVPEEFSRTAMMLGEETMQRLATARVAVVGIGGVGSYTAEALARTGIGRLLLIDSDTVSRSNLNRQIHATQQTIGQYKTQVMAERIRSINPQVQVRTKEVFCLPENITEVLEEPLDYVVDAVDTVSAKLAIIQFCTQRGIPVISAMGAGNKLDPTRFMVADIYSTSVCPLCRVMRHELRKRGIGALKVVYSQEPPRTPLPSPDDEKRQTPGSISFVPSVAGLILGGEVIRDLSGL